MPSRLRPFANSRERLGPKLIAAIGEDVELATLGELGRKRDHALDQHGVFLARAVLRMYVVGPSRAIDWLSSAELDEHLRSYAPIGLWLSDWFHARCDVDPRSTIELPAEVHFDEGLGELAVWSGFVDATPFAIRSMCDPRGAFGFEILLPARRGGDRANVELLAALADRLPAWRSPYFPQPPITTRHAVVSDTNDIPVYASDSRDDAAAIAAFLNRPVSSASFQVIVAAASAPRWLVVGPETGPYISRVASYASDEMARRQAAHWTAETGATFDVLPIGVP